MAGSLYVRLLYSLDSNGARRYGEWVEVLQMSITINLAPELQAELARQAATHGRAIETYAASLLEYAVHLPAGTSRLDRDRLENTLREMAQFSHKIPALPDEAFSRENLYQDHD